MLHQPSRQPFLGMQASPFGQPTEPVDEVRNLTYAAAFGNAVKGGQTKVHFFPAYVELALGAEALPEDGPVTERGGRRYVMRDHIGVVVTGDTRSAHCDLVQPYHKEVYADQWDAYQREDDLPDFGTPIQELPGIMARDILMIGLTGVQTIEQAASLDDTMIRDIGSYARPIREKARIWLERRDENATAAELADLRSERERESSLMREQMDRMEKRMRDLATENEAMQRVLRRSGASFEGAGGPAPGLVRADSAEAAALVGNGEINFGPDPMTQGPDEWDGSFDPGEPPSDES